MRALIQRYAERIDAATLRERVMIFLAATLVLVFIANLCFSPLAAIASVVVYFVIKEQKPRTAKDLCQMTWIPFVVWAVLVGLYLMFMGTMIFSGIMGSAGTY